MRESDRQQAMLHWLNVTEIRAELGGVSRNQVYGWIKSGELRAEDFRSKGAKVPRWRSRREWVDDFHARRMNRAA